MQKQYPEEAMLNLRSPAGHLAEPCAPGLPKMLIVDETLSLPKLLLHDVISNIRFGESRGRRRAGKCFWRRLCHLQCTQHHSAASKGMQGT